MASPDVFLSYNSLDRKVVRHIDECMQRVGLQTWLDESDLTPGQPWQPELENALLAARTVAVFVGEEGLGQWSAPESQVAIAESINTGKPVIPILLPGYTEAIEIPPFLARYTRIDMRAGITSNALHQLECAIRGGIRTEADRFAAAITKRMAELKRTVDELTEDQYQVLHNIRYERRALISGCAGSGKTLLVAEKAIRLERAGIRTLVLCHNPYLAAHIRRLVNDPAIDVLDMASLIAVLNGRTFSLEEAWSALHEPLNEDLDTAFDNAATLAPWHAILVDEGQDFRDSWWILIEALLDEKPFGVLYIFCDDNQALLPHRSEYPISAPRLSLSKNCRNSGNVFEIVRRCHKQAPLTSIRLRGEGYARISCYDTKYDLDALLEEGLLEACKHSSPDQLRVVTTESTASESIINGFSFVTQASRRWRPVVLADLTSLYTSALHKLAKLRSGSSHSEIANRFSMPLGAVPEEHLRVPLLSRQTLPTKEDVEAVNQFARRILPFFGGGHVGVETAVLEDSLKFQATGTRLYLTGMTHTGREKPVPAAFRASFYSKSTWSSTLEPGQPIQLRPFREARAQRDAVPIFPLDAYKGLEADSLILFVHSTKRNLLKELYVGSSRAIAYLNIIISRAALASLNTLADLDSEYFHDDHSHT